MFAVFVAMLPFATGAAHAAQSGRWTLYVGPGDSLAASLARDIASQVASATGQRISVNLTDGSVDTLGKLRDGNGFRLGIVNEDVAAAYGSAAERGFGEAAVLIAPLRAVATLNKLSFHFLVRADSRYRGLEDMRGARINLGPIEGNTAVSVMNYYQRLFGEPIANDRASFLEHEDALVRLVTDRSIDVVAIVGEQPLKVIADMKADARRFVRLVGVAQPLATDPMLVRAYPAEPLSARHYRNLIDDNVGSVAVRAVLAAYETRRGEGELELATFARALCERFPRLVREGGVGWRDVTLVQPEPALGWHYASPLVRGEIRRCSTGAPVNVPVPACTAVERAMRVCD